MLTLLDVDVTANRLVLAGIVLVLLCAAAGMLGIGVLGRLVDLGVAAEIAATVGIGVTLLLAFREQGFIVLTETLGAEANSDGSVFLAMLAALAVGGWVFIGFDVGVGAAEETRDAARHVLRAIWVALLGVGFLVIVNGVAATLAHPDPDAVVAGEDVDPVTTAVVSSFGDWSSKPFAAVVLTAFVTCGGAAQALSARTIFSLARDGALPGSGLLSRVDARRNPTAAMVTTAVVAALGLLLGLDSTAVGSLIAFGTAAIYLSFLLTALAALAARVAGTWRPPGPVRLGSLGTTVNVLTIGLGYLLLARPHRRLGSARPHSRGHRK